MQEAFDKFARAAPEQRQSVIASSHTLRSLSFLDWLYSSAASPASMSALQARKGISSARQPEGRQQNGTARQDAGAERLDEIAAAEELGQRLVALRQGDGTPHDPQLLPDRRAGDAGSDAHAELTEAGSSSALEALVPAGAAFVTAWSPESERLLLQKVCVSHVSA
jgi:hypothetical protein